MGGAGEVDEDLWAWWQANSLDVESSMAHVDALVYGRSYVTVAAPDPSDPFIVDPSVPIIRVESPTSMYADIDPRTRAVRWAIRVVRDSQGDEVAATLYTPDRTEIYEHNGQELQLVQTISHGLGIVPVIPIVCRQRVSDYKGKSSHLHGLVR